MKLYAAIAAAVAAVVSMPAHSAVLTFEEIGVQNNYTPQGALGFSTLGFHFSSNTSVIDLNAGSPWQNNGPAHSGEFAALDNYGGDISMTKVGGGTFDVSSFFIKYWVSSPTSTAVARGFRNGVQIASQAYSVTNAYNLVTLNFTNIDSISFDTGTGYNVLVDDITVNAGAPVPEPATWAMMIAGFGLVGGAMRRRTIASSTYA